MNVLETRTNTVTVEKKEKVIFQDLTLFTLIYPLSLDWISKKRGLSPILPYSSKKQIDTMYYLNYTFIL